MTDRGDITRPMRNLSVRNRLRPGERLPRKPRETKRPRKTIDHSAKGAPASVQPPITVGPDPLLQLLKGGQR